jgi:hypothetical protein
VHATHDVGVVGSLSIWMALLRAGCEEFLLDFGDGI